MNKKRGIRFFVSVLMVLVMVFSYTGGMLGVVNADEPESTVELKVRDWSKYCSRNFYNTMSDKNKALYDKMDAQCKEVLEGRLEPKKFGSYYLPEITEGDFTRGEFLSVLTMFLNDNPIYFFTSTGVRYSDEGYYSLVVYTEFSDKNTRIQATNDLFDKIDAWVEEIKNNGSTRYELAKLANDKIIDNVYYNSSSEGVMSLHQSIYSVFISGKSVCRGYSLAMTTLLNALGVPCWTVENSYHSWNKVLMDDDKWYATDVTWNDDGSAPNYKFMNQSDEAIKFRDGSSNTHKLSENYPAPKCESTYYPPGATVVIDGGKIVFIMGGGSDDPVDDDPVDDDKKEQDGNKEQGGQNSGKEQGGQNSGDNQNNQNNQNDQKTSVGKEKTGYSNEWINGKWYNADGTQTYKGTLKWKSDATGWWVEDTDGWYPTNAWQKIDGTWYFFKPDGYMAMSEYYGGYWFNADGSWDSQYLLTWKSNSTGWWVEDISGWWPASSWLKIDGNWYYFDASGYMVTNRYVDGWWIGADGICN